MAKSPNSLFSCKCIPIQDELSGDWFEDAESDPDWVEKLNAAESFVESNCGENYTQQFDELIEKNKILETRWKESEKLNESLQAEIEKFKLQLANEKQRSTKFQKKLRYIEDNHDIFNRLKQTYLSLKYNESSGRNIVEVRETAAQTWEGVLCRNCIQTAEIMSQRQLENLCSFTKNLPAVMTVRQTDVETITDTVSKLKDMINKREATYELNIHRDIILREKVKSLENHNRILQDLCKGMSPQTVSQPVEGQGSSTNKGCAVLKKIIFKQEKRLREMIKCNGNDKPSVSYLNDIEREIVEAIISKYLKRLGKKNVANLRSMSCDRDVSRDKKRVTGHGDMARVNTDACRFGTKDPGLKTDDVGDLIDFTTV